MKWDPKCKYHPLLHPCPSSVYMAVSQQHCFFGLWDNEWKCGHDSSLCISPYLKSGKKENYKMWVAVRRQPMILSLHYGRWSCFFLAPHSEYLPETKITSNIDWPMLLWLQQKTSFFILKFQFLLGFLALLHVTVIYFFFYKVDAISCIQAYFRCF